MYGTYLIYLLKRPSCSLYPDSELIEFFFQRELGLVKYLAEARIVAPHTDTERFPFSSSDILSSFDFVQERTRSCQAFRNSLI
jgi:hypothetical protein